MAHSKRNTSLPIFTAHERSQLRTSGLWGSQRSLISRDSFLPFAACRLCLQPAREPVVACAVNGDVFCRECAIADLLAQRQEIKRLEREKENAKKLVEEDEERMVREAKEREVRDFELVSMGLSLDRGTTGGGKKRKMEEVESEIEGERERHAALKRIKDREVEINGVKKRVFELDEKEMKRLAAEEVERLKRELKREKSQHKSALPSFWVPSLTPGQDPNQVILTKTVKLTPVCPGSTETKQHHYSLKALVDVHFTEEKAADGTISRICPSCKKGLSNGLRAMLTKPCGHVICSPCVNKFMTPQTDVPDPHASKEEQDRSREMCGRVLCYVCETDVTAPTPTPSTSELNGADKQSTKKKKKKSDDGAVQPGLVEISSEGTGFAGRGGNVAIKAGVAFQC